MNKVAPFIALILLAGCAAPPPVRIASSILGRTVGKELKDEYQKAHGTGQDIGNTYGSRHG